MEERSKKGIPLEKLTTSIVYEHLKSKNCIDNLFKDLLAKIKETPSYKNMKEVAMQHMKKILNDPSKTVPCVEDRVEKRKQIAEIGLLALSIESSMSQIISYGLHEKAESLINNALKDLMGNEVVQHAEMVTESPKSPSKAKGKCNGNVAKYIKAPELLEHKASNACKNAEQTQATTSKSQSKMSITTSDDSRRVLSRRIRKPNSKYASEDMLLDQIHSRHKDLLDVQRDLNIINGIDTQLNKEAPRSSFNRKRKADSRLQYHDI